MDWCLPVSTTVCLSQLVFACLNYCLPVSTVCPQLKGLLYSLLVTDESRLDGVPKTSLALMKQAAVEKDSDSKGWLLTLGKSKLV